MRSIIGKYKFSAGQYRAMNKAGIIPTDPPKKAPDLMSRRFTVDEYMRMAEVGVLDSDDRVELIDGVIIEMAPIGRPHGNRVSRITSVFMEKAPADVQVYIGSTIRLNDQTGPEPDIALLTPQASFDAENIPRPEDILLIVEVSGSTLRSDRVSKALRYAQSGIPELWIFDLADGEIEVSRQPTPQGYADIRRYRPGDTLTIQALPEIRLTVDQLIA